MWPADLSAGTHVQTSVLGGGGRKDGGRGSISQIGGALSHGQDHLTHALDHIHQSQESQRAQPFKCAQNRESRGCVGVVGIHEDNKHNELDDRAGYDEEIEAVHHVLEVATDSERLHLQCHLEREDGAKEGTRGELHAEHLLRSHAKGRRAPVERQKACVGDDGDDNTGLEVGRGDDAFERPWSVHSERRRVLP